MLQPAHSAKNPSFDGVSPQIKRLYGTAMGIVSKELKHLKLRVIGSKLDSKDASDLVAYVKLLGEVKKQQLDLHAIREAAEAKAREVMSDDEIEKQLKELLKKGKK